MLRFRRTNLENLTDEELTRRYAEDGVGEAFDVLFGRYAEYVMGVCKMLLRTAPEDIEDNVMDIFAKVSVRLSNPKPIESFKDWLFIVTKNHCLKSIAANERLKELFMDTAEINLENFVQNEEDGTLYNNGLILLLHDNLGQLSDIQQMCIHAFYWEEKSYNEIAAAFNMDFNEVRTTLQTSRRILTRTIQPLRNYEE